MQNGENISVPNFLNIEDLQIQDIPVLKLSQGSNGSTNSGTGQNSLNQVEEGSTKLKNKEIACKKTKNNKKFNKKSKVQIKNQNNPNPKQKKSALQPDTAWNTKCLFVWGNGLCGISHKGTFSPDIYFQELMAEKLMLGMMNTHWEQIWNYRNSNQANGQFDIKRAQGIIKINTNMPSIQADEALTFDPKRNKDVPIRWQILPSPMRKGKVDEWCRGLNKFGFQIFQKQGQQITFGIEVILGALCIGGGQLTATVQMPKTNEGSNQEVKQGIQLVNHKNIENIVDQKMRISSITYIKKLSVYDITTIFSFLAIVNNFVMAEKLGPSLCVKIHNPIEDYLFGSLLSFVREGLITQEIFQEYAFAIIMHSYMQRRFFEKIFIQFQTNWVPDRFIKIEFDSPFRILLENLANECGEALPDLRPEFRNIEPKCLECAFRSLAQEATQAIFRINDVMFEQDLQQLPDPNKQFILNKMNTGFDSNILQLKEQGSKPMSQWSYADFLHIAHKFNSLFGKDHSTYPMTLSLLQVDEEAIYTEGVKKGLIKSEYQKLFTFAIFLQSNDFPTGDLNWFYRDDSLETTFDNYGENTLVYFQDIFGLSKEGGLSVPICQCKKRQQKNPKSEHHQMVDPQNSCCSFFSSSNQEGQETLKCQIF